MKKIINVRPPLFVAVSLAVGIAAARYVFSGNWWIFAVACVCYAGITVFCVVTRKNVAMAICCVVALAVGFALMTASAHSQFNDEVIDCKAEVSGRVTDVARNGKESNSVYLDECYVNGKSVKGKILYYSYDATNIRCGDMLVLKGTLNTAYGVQGSTTNTFYSKNNVKYLLSSATIKSQTQGKMKLDERIRKYVYDRCNEYMDSNADVAYALLCGDRNAMDDDKYTVFQRAGITHLLAVSGLHVGVVVAAITLVLKRFKLRPAVELAIIVLPLLFYAWICGFSPSVSRAVIMLCCVYVAKIFHGKADLLNSLGIAATIILLFRPVYLFDLGFKLSFLSVFGISTLFLPINRWISAKVKSAALRYVISSAATTTCCSLITAFCVAAHFGEVPTFGLITNVVAIPVLSFAFIICFVGMLPWIFGYVLWFADKLLWLVNVVASFTASFDFATTAISAAVTATIGIIVLAFLAGGYVNVGKIAKCVISALCVAVILFDCIYAATDKPCENQAAVFFGYDDTAIVMSDKSGDVAVLCNFVDEYVTSDTTEYLSTLKISACDLYVSSFVSCNFNLLKDFCDNIDVTKVYVADRSSNGEAQEYLENNDINVVYVVKNDVVGSGKVRCQVAYDGALRAVVMENSAGLSVCSIFGGTIAVDAFAALRSDVDVFVLPQASQRVSNSGKVSLTLKQSTLAGNYGANKYGNFTITQRYDKIILNFI